MREHPPTEEEVANLLRQYLDARAALKRAGVLRSDRTVQSDYAEWLVAKRLNLRLVDNAVQAGYDATDESNRKHQIKGRVVRMPSIRPVLHPSRSDSLATFGAAIVNKPTSNAASIEAMP